MFVGRPRVAPSRSGVAMTRRLDARGRLMFVGRPCVAPSHETWFIWLGLRKAEYRPVSGNGTRLATRIPKRTNLQHYVEVEPSLESKPGFEAQATLPPREMPSGKTPFVKEDFGFTLTRSPPG
nr:hypothetical protein CFP56_30965 [Quercus suber]